MRPLLQEAGGHRWQRIPPTERRGRVHTSTVTVVVLPLTEEREFQLKDADIRVETTRGTGPGGQHRNKTESAVKMTHLPTGITAKAEAKSQHANKRTARAVLEARVADHFRYLKAVHLKNERATQAGSGMRGDKIRTYRQRDDVVTDHRSEKKCRLSAILKGELERLS